MSKHKHFGSYYKCGKKNKTSLIKETAGYCIENSIYGIEIIININALKE